jgi:hypothetical protein
MLTVGKDEAGVERRLREGGLCCPDCAGHLCPWGWAAPRTVWGIGWWRRIRPRRSRCRRCGRTHVLSPVNVLWHRRDDVSVIGEALTRSALGEGFRSIARLLGRPEATVRGWIRRMRRLAEPIRVAFTLVRAGLVVDAPFVAVAGSPLAEAVGAVLATAAAAGERFAELAEVAVSAPWEVACAVTGGMLPAPPGVGFRINMNHTLVGFGR